LDREVVPFWGDEDARWTRIDLKSSSPNYATRQFLRTVTNGHLHGYQHVVASLRQNNDKMTDSAMLELQRVDEIVRDHNANNEVPSDE
jgi:hypothetical protein